MGRTTKLGRYHPNGGILKFGKETFASAVSVLGRVTVLM